MQKKKKFFPIWVKSFKLNTLAICLGRDIKPDSYQLLVIIDQGVIFVTNL